MTRPVQDLNCLFCNLKACSVISIKLVINFISLPLIGEEPGMETIPEAYI